MTGPSAPPQVSRWLTSRTRRACEVVVTAVLLVLTAPLLAVLALLVLVTMGRPVLFRHERAGRDGRPFTLLKLRSMSPAPDPPPDPPEGADADPVNIDEGRVTRLGRFLRTTSLDELPGLLNVLRGDLSLVGPRPLLLEYVDLYTAEQAERLRVRPGVTGPAQVNGRNALDWDERFRLDVEYVRRATPRTDLMVVLRTVGKVVGRDGVTVGDQETPDKFRGSDAADGRAD